MDHELFDLGDFELQSGKIFPGLQLAYKTYGQLNASGDNAVRPTTKPAATRV